MELISIFGLPSPDLSLSGQAASKLHHHRATIKLASKIAVKVGAFAYFAMTINFLNQYSKMNMSPEPAIADAIVVPTGSPDREPAAFRHLAANQKLFITGMERDATLSSLMKLEHIKLRPDQKPEQVELDYQAQSDIGNAIKIADFLEQNPKIRHVTVVTSELYGPRIAEEIKQEFNKRGITGVSINYSWSDHLLVRSSIANFVSV